MKAQFSLFSKYRRIIQNQKLIQLIVVSIGIFCAATPLFIVLLFPYIQILFVLWLCAIFSYTAIKEWEKRNPKVQ